MNLNWLEEFDRSFLDIVQIIQYSKNPAILQTAFVNNLLLAYWDSFQYIIASNVFLPFFFYLVFFLYFMISELTEYVSEEN